MFSKTTMFPPVNAPFHVKDACDKAIDGLNTHVKMVIELHAHRLTYGLSKDGSLLKDQLPQAEQWSKENTVTWFSNERATLEFNVKQYGWTEINHVQEDFYNRFEEALV
jgi:hypothetical protein